MKKLLILLALFISFTMSAQKPSVIIARGDTITTLTDTTWFYSYDTNLNEIKMIRLYDIFGGIAATALNTAKLTNATHTGDVAGAGALTIQTDAVDIAMISASGTASGTTFLRGDNTWSVPVGSGDLLANGSVPLTANWDVGAYTITGTQFTSDIAIGTAPLVVTSTTVVTNLNADLLDGESGVHYMDNTDTQDLGITGNNVTLTDGGTADVSTTTAVTANSNKTTNATHTGDVTGSAALAIADDAVTESDLKAVNSPTDEYVLTYEATTGDFEWEVDAGTAYTADYGLALVGTAFNLDTAVTDAKYLETSDTLGIVYGAGIDTAYNALQTQITISWDSTAVYLAKQAADATLTALAALSITENILFDDGITLGNEDVSGGILTILEDTDDGSNYASFMAPPLTANTVYILPVDDGDANEILSTNGTGTLEWVADAGGGVVTSYTNTGDNRIITSSGTTVINGESTLTYDGTDLSFGSAVIQEAEMEILDGATVTTTELNVLDEATLSSIDSWSVKATYVFADDGGGIQDALGLTATVPAGSVITRVITRTTVAFTSAGSATVAINVGATEVLAATAFDDGAFTGVDVQYSTPVEASGEVNIDIAVAALTAGTYDIWVEYLQ